MRLSLQIWGAMVNHAFYEYLTTCLISAVMICHSYFVKLRLYIQMELFVDFSSANGLPQIVAISRFCMIKVKGSVKGTFRWPTPFLRTDLKWPRNLCVVIKFSKLTLSSSPVFEEVVPGHSIDSSCFSAPWIWSWDLGTVKTTSSFSPWPPSLVRHCLQMANV